MQHHRVGDVLLAINGESVIGWTSEQAEAVLKALPRGLFRLTAMAPPKDVTGSGVLSAAPPSPGPPSPGPPAPTLPMSTQATDEHAGKSEQADLSGKEVVEKGEEGIIEVTLERCNGGPLGFEVEGGLNAEGQMIHIKSLSHNSPAFGCGWFSQGDQLLMVGEICLVGKTLDEARHVLETAPASVLVVAQRKVSPKLVSKTQDKLSLGTASHASASNIELTLSEVPQVLNEESSGTDEPISSDLQDHPELIASNIYNIPDVPPASNTEQPVSSTGNTAQSVSLQHILTKANSVEELKITPDTYRGVVSEEKMTIRLERASGEKFGLTFIGGSDNPRLCQVHVSDINWMDHIYL